MACIGALASMGEIINAFNGQPIPDYNALITKLIAFNKPGETVTLNVWRNGQSVDLKVVLSERPR